MTDKRSSAEQPAGLGTQTAENTDGYRHGTSVPNLPIPHRPPQQPRSGGSQPQWQPQVGPDSRGMSQTDHHSHGSEAGMMNMQNLGSSLPDINAQQMMNQYNQPMSPHMYQPSGYPQNYSYQQQQIPTQNMGNWNQGFRGSFSSAPQLGGHNPQPQFVYSGQPPQSSHAANRASFNPNLPYGSMQHASGRQQQQFYYYPQTAFSPPAHVMGHHFQSMPMDPRRQGYGSASNSQRRQQPNSGSTGMYPHFSNEFGTLYGSRMIEFLTDTDKVPTLTHTLTEHIQLVHCCRPLFVAHHANQSNQEMLFGWEIYHQTPMY
jgi:hypothetical protein